MELEQRPTNETLPSQTKKSTTADTAGTSSPQEAGSRCDRIRVLLTSMADQTNKVGDILEVAQTNEDHVALGYPSWTAYLAGEYAGRFADLSRAVRREVVGSLTAIGMSTRAIAPVVGVSRQQVATDRQVASSLPPGREDGDDVDHRVTGMDGKSYGVRRGRVVEPKKSRRPSLTDQYRAAIYELDKAVRRLEKLHADDRFAHHRDSFGHHRHLLLQLADKVILFANEVSGERADRVVVEMSSEGELGGAR